MNNISKDFTGVRALQNIDFDLKAGEVHSIVGANGAGKSTLINILGGVYSNYLGSITIYGMNTKINTPRKSKQLGITLISQEFSLINSLSISENIYLGTELSILPNKVFINRKLLNQQSKLLLKQFGLNKAPETKVSKLSIVEKQIVEILKALARKSQIMIMDEPTSALTANETYLLYDIVRELKKQEIAVIFISHRLEDIFEISDRVSVLRDGIKVFEANINSTSHH